MKNKNNSMIIVLVIIALLFFGGLGYGVMSLFGGHYTGYYGFGGLFAIIACIAAILVIYDVIANNKKLSDGAKVVWIIFALLFSIITAIVYYLVKRKQ